VPKSLPVRERTFTLTIEFASSVQEDPADDEPQALRRVPWPITGEAEEDIGRAFRFCYMHVRILVGL
jgi:hypothetical protein